MQRTNSALQSSGIALSSRGFVLIGVSFFTAVQGLMMPMKRGIAAETANCGREWSVV